MLWEQPQLPAMTDTVTVTVANIGAQGQFEFEFSMLHFYEPRIVHLINQQNNYRWHAISVSCHVIPLQCLLLQREQLVLSKC